MLKIKEIGSAYESENNIKKEIENSIEYLKNLIEFLELLSSKI